MPIVQVQKGEIKLIRSLDQIDLPYFKRGLLAPPSFPWLPASISSEEVLPTVQSKAPVDGVEIVEWMQLAASHNAVLESCAECYARAGSLLSFAASDPWTPGVRCGDLRVTSVSGSQIKSQGYGTIITPRGNFNCPYPGKATAIFSDILAWAALPWSGGCQWLLSLLQWKDLATTPISQRLAFPNLNGCVAPQFCIVKSQYFPPPAVTMHMGFTSSRAQKVAMNLRNSGDYTSILASDALDIPAGQSTLDYLVVCPGVSEFCLHLQPEDGASTVLDSLTTTPP